MLWSDDQLRDIARAGNRKPGESIGVYSGGVKALRAVEAAVRADQIERDAAIAAGVPASHYDFEGYPTWPSPREVAAAIRAQLNGDNSE